MNTFTVETHEDGFIVTCDCGTSYFADKMADVIYIEDDGCDSCDGAPEPEVFETDLTPLTATIGEALIKCQGPYRAVYLR